MRNSFTNRAWLQVELKIRVMFTNCFDSYKKYLEADYRLWFFPPAYIDVLPTYLIPDEL